MANPGTRTRSSLRGTSAVIFHPDGDAFGLDSVTPVPYHLGVVVSQSRDRLAIRAIEDVHGTRHKTTRYTYRLDRYPCGMFAALRARPLEEVLTVSSVRAWLRELIYDGWYRDSVINHDLDQICECYARGWRRT